MTEQKRTIALSEKAQTLLDRLTDKLAKGTPPEKKEEAAQRILEETLEYRLERVIRDEEGLRHLEASLDDEDVSAEYRCGYKRRSERDRQIPWDQRDRVDYDFEKMREEIDELIKPRD